MMKIKRPDFIPPFLTNKYLLTFIVCSIWMIFIDNNNFIFIHKNSKKLDKLIVEKAYFENKIKADHQKLKELKTNTTNLEKFAREQYLMKKENEDIFVIIEE